MINSGVLAENSAMRGGSKRVYRGPVADHVVNVSSF